MWTEEDYKKPRKPRTKKNVKKNYTTKDEPNKNPDFYSPLTVTK